MKDRYSLSGVAKRKCLFASFFVQLCHYISKHKENIEENVFSCYRIGGPSVYCRFSLKNGFLDLSLIYDCFAVKSNY